MRTALFLLVGGLLLAASLLLGRLFEAEFPQARLTARAAFLAAWAALTLFSLWASVARAGYGLAEEVPIHLALFAVPAAAAWLLRG